MSEDDGRQYPDFYQEAYIRAIDYANENARKNGTKLVVWQDAIAVHVYLNPRADEAIDTGNKTKLTEPAE